MVIGMCPLDKKLLRSRVPTSEPGEGTCGTARCSCRRSCCRGGRTCASGDIGPRGVASHAIISRNALHRSPEVRLSNGAGKLARKTLFLAES